jgi:hypothetical protein
MTQIGKPAAEPISVPATWEFPEPKKEEVPAQQPEREPERVPTPV